MVQRVRDDGVLLRKERLKDTTVRIKAGCVEDSVLCAEVVGNSLFKGFVDILATADETHRRHTETALVHSALCGLNQARVVRESEVVVGAEVQTLLLGYLNSGTLWRTDYSLGLIKTGLFD